MTLGRYDYERRYRHRIWGALLKVILGLGTVLIACLFSYQMGIEQLKGRDAALRDDVSRLSMRNAELELLATQMKTAAREAEARLRDAETQLRRDVPQGDRAKLLDIVTRRLSAGITADRLAFVVEHAENPRNCQNAETKRFVVTTPLLKNTRAVSFSNGTVSVTGEGISVRDPKNGLESWFDPAQPVTIKITLIGGRQETLEGVLPLHTTVVTEGAEYRFAFNAAARSFIEAAVDRCAFP